MSGEKQAQFEEEVGGRCKNQLAQNIGRGENGSEDENAYQHIGPFIANGFILYNATVDKAVSHQRELEHEAEGDGEPKGEAHHLRNSHDGLDVQGRKTHAEIDDQWEADKETEGGAANKENAGKTDDFADELLFVFVEGREDEFPDAVGDVGECNENGDNESYLHLQDENFHRRKIMQDGRRFYKGFGEKINAVGSGKKCRNKDEGDRDKAADKG